MRGILPPKAHPALLRKHWCDRHQTGVCPTCVLLFIISILQTAQEDSAWDQYYKQYQFVNFFFLTFQAGVKGTLGRLVGIFEVSLLKSLVHLLSITRYIFVLVHSRYYNKIPQTRSLINNRNCFLMLLEAWKSKLEVSADSVSGGRLTFSFIDSCFLLCSLMVAEGRLLSRSLLQGTDPIHGDKSSYSNHHLKPPFWD